MGSFIEPLIINGINKDVAPGALDYSGRTVLNPVRDVLNCRYLTSEGEQAGKVEHIKGSEQGPTFNKYQEITVNSDFIGSLSPWIEFSTGDLSWTYSSGTARVSTTTAGALTTKKLIYNNPNAFLGQSAAIRAKMTLESGFTSVRLFCHIYNYDAVLLETISVGDLTLPSTSEFVINKVLPAGAVSFAFSMELDGPGGTSAANVDYFKVEAVASTSTPAGQNEIIGTYENVEKNILIFWLWNSNGYHGVFKYNYDDDEILQLLADSPNDPILKFDRYHLIANAGMIGDILTWTDNLNPQRYINVTRDYTVFNDLTISLAKIGPRNPPTFTTRVTDSSVTFNKLASDSFQFAYQYIYLDNETSVLSPFSKLCSGDILPEVASTDRSKIQITHTVDSDVSALIKEVRLLYRKNNDPNWYVWKKVTNFSSSIAEYFFNNEQGTVVPESQATKLFDEVPNRSKALTVFRGRIFLNINEEGFDFVPPSLSFSLTTVNLNTTTDIPATNTQERGAFLKKNGNYLVGIFFRGKFGRLSGINSKTSVNNEHFQIDLLYDINANPTTVASFNREAHKVNISLSGTGLPDAEYFIAITKEQNYLSYMQLPAHVLWYVGSAEGGNDINPFIGLDTIKIDGTDRIYLKNIPSGNTYKYIHLLLPKELPFVPDKDCYVRIAAVGITRVERVLDVLDGDILVTGNFGIENWSSEQKSVYGVPLIEVFKPNNAVDPFFYQVSGPYTTDSNGVLQTTAINNIEADTFELFLKEFSFKPYNIQAFQKIDGRSRQSWVTPYIFIESPTPIATKSVVKTDDLTQSNFFISISGGVHQSKGLTVNFEKSAFSKGWPVVEAKPLLQYRPATLRFSDPYIEGSEINGLNSFPVENVYDKIGQDRSPITKLIAVGNVLVAVHERHVTSLYVGEGIIRTGETGFLSKVDDVIGDDRKLIGEMGSYNPESLQGVDGQLFGFDIYKGVVWRYTVEGIYAVSNYGMSNYFKERARKYFPYRDSMKFVSGVDPYHKEYMLTMPPLYAHLATMELQTIGTASYQCDFTLDPELYTVGETYRLKVLLYKQTGTEDQTVTLNAYFDGDELQVIDESDINHRIITNSKDEADPIYLEFEYNGEGLITILIENIVSGIYATISSEYQELNGETWSFNYKANGGKGAWSHRYSFVPDYFGKIANQVLAFKKGVLWKMNTLSAYNNFFNKHYDSRIEVEANPQPGKDKTWSAIQIDREALAADETGTFKVLEVSNDKGQESYTRVKEFDKENGVYLGSILKDVNTNALLLPAGTIALRDGKDMRSKTLNVVINSDSTEAARMQKINVIGQFSEVSS